MLLAQIATRAYIEIAGGSRGTTVAARIIIDLKPRLNEPLVLAS